MKRCISFLAFILLVMSGLVFAEAPGKWKSTNSTHFIIHYKNAPEQFIEELIDQAEDHYNKIADALGFRRFDFWLWERRAKIYIYDDIGDYQSSTGQPGWSGGFAVAREKIIETFPYAHGFFEAILPHELAHIIFREFVGFDNYAIPLWLEEGVASLQEKYKYSSADKVVRAALSGGKFVDIERLAGFDPASAQNNSSVEIFYAEAASVVDYLMKKFGRDSFVVFCQNLRDKKNLKEALRSAYPFENLQELNDAWRKYITK